MNYYGSLKEKKDRRDYKLSKKIAKAELLPETFEISLKEVKNQGSVNSCVAHSLSSCMEYIKDNKDKMSVGFIYGYRPSSYHQGEGMYPREALKTLQQIGDCKYIEFPYNKEVPEIKKLVNNQINDLKSYAFNNKIKSYARIYTINEIKKCLLNNCPVPISIPVYNDLAYDNNFIIKEPIGDIQGYHMVTLYGWTKEGFMLQNSWGTNWGNKGKVILPYSYPIDSAWAISTENNQIETYQTLIQKLYAIIADLLKKLRSK